MNILIPDPSPSEKGELKTLSEGEGNEG